MSSWRSTLTSVVCAWAASFGTAVADRDVAQYRALKKAGAIVILENWFDGAITGMSWMNTEIGLAGGRKVYCQPPGYAIGPRAAMELFETYLPLYLSKYGKPESEILVGAVLLLALKDAFPCR